MTKIKLDIGLTITSRESLFRPNSNRGYILYVGLARERIDYLAKPMVSRIEDLAKVLTWTRTIESVGQDGISLPPPNDGLL